MSSFCVFVWLCVLCGHVSFVCVWLIGCMGVCVYKFVCSYVSIWVWFCRCVWMCVSSCAYVWVGVYNNECERDGVTKQERMDGKRKANRAISFVSLPFSLVWTQSIDTPLNCSSQKFCFACLVSLSDHWVRFLSVFSWSASLFVLGQMMTQPLLKLSSSRQKEEFRQRHGGRLS